ncbi:unnamed protein product, partial [Ectocarpus fasciculatus]
GATPCQPRTLSPVAPSLLPFSTRAGDDDEGAFNENRAENVVLLPFSATPSEDGDVAVSGENRAPKGFFCSASSALTPTAAAAAALFLILARASVEPPAVLLLLPPLPPPPPLFSASPPPTAAAFLPQALPLSRCHCFDSSPDADTPVATVDAGAATAAAAVVVIRVSRRAAEPAPGVE